MKIRKLTAEEKRAVARARKALESLPETLWCWVASTSFWIMLKGENGQHIMTESGGVDPDYEVGNIEVECDGGDW